MQKLIGCVVVAVLLFIGTIATLSCGWSNEGKNMNRRIRVREIYPYDPNTSILRTTISIFFPDMAEARIMDFEIQNIEATDQRGQVCPFAGVWTGVVKGGLDIELRNKIDPEKAEKVTVRAHLVLNRDIIEVTCGFRKRTAAERAALNYNWEWTYLEGAEEPKAKIVGRRSSGFDWGKSP